VLIVGCWEEYLVIEGAGIAGLLPQSPHRLAWQPSALVSQPYGAPTSVTWLQLLRQQTNTGTLHAHWLQKHTDLWAHEIAFSPDLWHQPRLANITCA